MPRRGTSTASRFCGSTKTCSPDETPSRSGAGPSSAPGAGEPDQGDPKLNEDAEPEGTDGGDPGDAARQVGVVAHAAEDDGGGEAGTGGDGRRLPRAGIRIFFSVSSRRAANRARKGGGDNQWTSAAVAVGALCRYTKKDHLGLDYRTPQLRKVCRTA